MLKQTKLIFIILSVVNFAQCKAQTEKVSEQSKSTIEIRAEIFENLQKSKLKLEKIYEESIEYLDSIGNIDTKNYNFFLIDSQNGWKAYSEGKCKISEYQSRDAAQGGLSFYNLCMTDLNIVRTTELKNWLTEWKREFDNY